MSQSDVVDLLGGRSLDTIIDNEFLERFGLPSPTQYGVVCRGIPEKITELESLGCRPFVYAKKLGAPGFVENGVKKDVKISLALGYTEDGRHEVELITPISGTEFYEEKVPADGSYALHHVCCLTNDRDGTLERLEAAGYSATIKGALNLGFQSTHYAYVDTREELGVWLEIAQYRLLGRYAPPNEKVITRLAGMQRWFGKPG